MLILMGKENIHNFRLKKCVYLKVLLQSEEPDEMPHSAAFHQGLHCLLRHYYSSMKKCIFHVFEILSA